MRVKKYVKSKKILRKIITLISIAIVTLSMGFNQTHAQTKQLSNDNIKVVDNMRNRKEIGIKNRTASNSDVVTINGKVYKCKKMNVKATAYTSAPSEGGAYAYNGQRLKYGMIASDFKVLPLGTKVYIPQLNKIFIVTDTGSAIRNNKIDIFMNSYQEAIQWGIKTIDIYVLE